MDSRDRRNRLFFGFGTIGRDMFYSLESMFLMVYLTEVLDLSNEMLAWVGGILTGLRVFDALNDPVMGVIIDNTKSRWGKFKPAMLFGAVTSAIFMVLLFTDLGLSPAAYIVCFVLFYLAWDITYGLNDIAYWSMLPALTLDQKKREKIGSFARVCANIGLFAVVVGMEPITDSLTAALGDKRQAWFVFALVIAILMIGFQLFTVFGAKEQRGAFKNEEKTTLRGMAKALFKNDQLLFTFVSMALFMVGYMSTTNLGWHFIAYAYGNADVYPVFAGVVGVSQIGALLIFPWFSRRFTRKQLYTAATILVVAGYLLFFFTPMNLIPIGIAGALLFIGEAFIQILMLMFLTDTIEYGQWKSGKRNEAVTFSVQPLINKIGGAIGTGVMTLTLINSGINEADTLGIPVTPEGITQLKLAMFILPLVCIVVGYLVYLWKYKIDKKFYDQIVSDLAARGDIREDII